MADHPKVMGLGKLAPLALGLQMRALCWASRHLTDGILPKECLPSLVMDLDPKVDWPTAMVNAGLWEKTRAGYAIHDYLEYNPSREETLAARERNAERQRNFRNRNGHRNGTVTRDNGVSSAVSNDASNGPVTLPPSPSPSPRESKTLSAPDGAALKSSPPEAKTKTTSRKPTWLTPFVDIWVRTYGGQPACGELAKHLRPLLEGRAIGELLDHWARYLVATAPEYVSPARFAQTYGKWGKPERARAGVPDMYLTLEEQAARRAKTSVRPSPFDPTLPAQEDR